jgi:hypothetical protein
MYWLLSRPFNTAALLLIMGWIADLFYPPTRSLFISLLSPYHAEIETWGNVFISLMIALCIFGFCWYLLGIGKVTCTKIAEKLQFPVESEDYSDNSFLLPSSRMIGLGSLWAAYTLAFMAYLRIWGPFIFWRELLHFDEWIPGLLFVISVVIKVAAIGALFVAGVLWVIAYRKAISTKLREWVKNKKEA